MLRRLAVRNWRAFPSAEVTFRPGVNVLLGRNGVGKTSLLEAVAFALAGEPALLSDVKQMARADGTAVDVMLGLDLDGEEWEIARGLGPTHRRGAESVRRGRRTVAEGSAAVTAELERLFAVPSDFFLRILYMPEGDVYRFLGNSPLAALDEHLRRVLGLERLAQIDRVAGQVKREVANERSRLTTMADRVASQSQTLAEGRTRWSGDLAATGRTLEAERARLTAEVSTATSQRRAAEDAVHRIDRSLADLDAIDREHRELSGTDDPHQLLRDLRARGAELVVAVRGLNDTIAKLTLEEKRLADRRQALATRSAAELAAGNTRLRARHDEITTAIGTLERTLAELTTEAELAARRGRVLQARSPADSIADDPELMASRDEREQRVRRLDDDLAAAASERQALAESTQFLEAHAPGAGVDPVCPVCRQPLPEVLRQRLLSENATRDAELVDRIATLRAQRASQIEEGRAEAESLKQRLVAENVEEAESLADGIASAQRQRRVLQEELRAELETARQQLLVEHDDRARGVTDRLRTARVERQSTDAAREQNEIREGHAFQRVRRLNDLDERRRALLPGDTTLDVLRERRERLAAEETAARAREAEVIHQADVVREELAALQGYLQLAALEGQTAAARAALARRELLAELFAAATTETLRQLREGAMSEAYRAAEGAWAGFSGWADAKIEPQARGRLAVRHAGRSLDLAQLSGGERAAFLALLHAQLGHRFGQGRFLLLDEPLEHLDAENGRRMLQHLLRACADGLLSQIVLATVEADVVEAVLQTGDAHVIRLPL